MTTTQIPTPASVRNAEQRTRESRHDEFQWDMALDGVRRKQTKMKILPSIQMHAWQSYELAKYGVLNRRMLWKRLAGAMASGAAAKRARV